MQSMLTATALIAIFFNTALIYSGGQVMAQSRLYSDAMRMEEHGKYGDATRLLERALTEYSDKISPEEKEKILFRIERMRRIRIDYSLTADELYSQLERGVRGMTHEEFSRWIREGKFDAREIDDTLRFVNTSRSNLFFRYPEIAARRIPPVDDKERQNAILSNCISIERAVDSLGTPYVLPKEFEMEMSVWVPLRRLTADSGTEIVKAWLPIPRRFPYQTDFKLLASSSKPLDVAPPESPIRSVFMEQPVEENGGVKFIIEYSYRTFGVHFRLDAGRVQPYDRSDAIYRKFTSEGPNIAFTSKIKRVSKEIVGSETNPLLKSRKIYEWISQNIMYSFAREYSTIENIGDYCLTKRYGDCGQEAMLFITLCRYNGIPARWQSGWFFFPGNQDIHDWTEIYILPYGWIPVDPYMGILTTRYMTDLTDAQRQTVRDFYFGGLDQYRMSANSDNNQELTPPKKFFRSDNVDFQRGELETARGNIYFDRSDYHLEIKEIPAD